VICAGFANRLRPKADFGGSRGYAGRGRRAEFVTGRPSQCAQGTIARYPIKCGRGV